MRLRVDLNRRTLASDVSTSQVELGGLTLREWLGARMAGYCRYQIILDDGTKLYFWGFVREYGGGI